MPIAGLSISGASAAEFAAANCPPDTKITGDENSDATCFDNTRERTRGRERESG